MDNNLREQVYNALKKAGLLHSKASLESVKVNGCVLTNANTNDEIIEVVKDIENLSILGDKFCGGMNGIMFTIKEKCY